MNWSRVSSLKLTSLFPSCSLRVSVVGLFKSLMSELQPRMEKFSSHPASVASLAWLVTTPPAE